MIHDEYAAKSVYETPMPTQSDSSTPDRCSAPLYQYRISIDSKLSTVVQALSRRSDTDLHI